MQFVVNYKVLGDHVHMKMYVGADNYQNMALSGKFVLRKDEFEAFRSSVGMNFQFSEEVDKVYARCVEL